MDPYEQGSMMSDLNRLDSAYVAFPSGPVNPAVRHVVRAKGLEPPQAFAYQDLNLARLPFPPRPQERLQLTEKVLEVFGGSPGNRTQNLRIKSPVLCLIELATRSECSNA